MARIWTNLEPRAILTEENSADAMNLMTISSSKERKRSDPHRGIAWNSVYNLISTGSRRGFISIVLLCFAAVLNTQEYALITVAISMAGVFAILANWGYVATITRYVSATIIRDGQSQTKRMARRLIARQIAVVIGALLVFSFLAPFVGPLLHIDWSIYVLACFIGFLASLSEALNAVLSGLEKFETLAHISVVWFLGTVSVALILLGTGFGLKSAPSSLVFLVVAFIALTFSTGLVSARALSGGVDDSTPLRTPWSEITQYCRQSGWYSIVGSVLYYRTEVLFLRHWGTAESVAAYALGQTLASVLFIALIRGVVGTLLPRFSRLHALGRKEQLDSLYVSIQRLFLYLLFPAAVVCIIVSPGFIPQVFGPQYRQSVIVFQLLVPVFVLTSHSAVGQSYLFAVSRQRPLVPLLTFCLFLNLLLDLTLIRPWGIVGAVLGVGIPLLVAAGGSLALAGMTSSLLPGVRPAMKAVAYMTGFVIAAKYIALSSSWTYPAGFGIVGIGGYTALMMPEFRSTWDSLRRSELVSATGTGKVP